jgi:polysaccharide export outer membrane protein
MISIKFTSKGDFNRKARISLLSALLLISVACASTNPKPNVHTVEEIESPPPVTEFTLGPGDAIDIKVWRHEDLTMRLKVDPYGKIYYPFLGEIKVTGMNINLLRESLTEGLTDYFVNPVVNVTVSSNRSQKVFVLGEVNQPGIFSLDGPMNVLEAVAYSGGFTRDAKKGNVLVVRGKDSKSYVIKLDLYAAIKRGELQHNISLQTGDVVYVPATVIADMAKYAEYVFKILRPILQIETGIVLGDEVYDVFTGERGRTGDRTVIIQTND